MTATITETFAPAIGPATNSPAAVREALSRLHEACHVVAVSDHVHITSSVPARGRLLAVLPPCVPQGLGSAAFRNAHRVKLAYLAGGMALGIASTDLVTAMARAGLLAAFGAGGLPLPDVERAAAQLSAATAGASYVMNLLHAPHDPALEQKTVEIYLQHGVRAVEASAFMDLTAALVRYRVSGLRRRGQAIAISHKVI
ncbi:MAG TPA: 2-nitropropane dioxygenase, partial [Mycobacterium sp.]|nr:2-nitropropane dioxygenase [Mycobacterium sp.]